MLRRIGSAGFKDTPTKIGFGHGNGGARQREPIIDENWWKRPMEEWPMEQLTKRGIGGTIAESSSTGGHLAIGNGQLDIEHIQTDSESEFAGQKWLNRRRAAVIVTFHFWRINFYDFAGKWPISAKDQRGWSKNIWICERKDQIRRREFRNNWKGVSEPQLAMVVVIPSGTDWTVPLSVASLDPNVTASNSAPPMITCPPVPSFTGEWKVTFRFFYQFEKVNNFMSNRIKREIW